MMISTTEKTYISGDELARYLHVSKRKMRYLLANGYIPMIDTGKKTHRYQVRREDAEVFKRKTQENPELLIHLTGLFGRVPRQSIIEPSEENRKKFRKYLTERWKNEPDALRVKRASELTGIDYRRIDKLCTDSIIQSVLMGRAFVCAKSSFIEYCSTTEMLIKAQITPEFRQLIIDFIDTEKIKDKSKKKGWA